MASYDQAMTMAYLRKLGFDEAEARAYAARQRDRINRQVALRVPETQEQGIEQRRSISLNREASGLLRSGETERRLAIQRRGEMNRIGEIEGGAADALGGVESDLARSVAETRRNTAEAGGYGY